MTSFAQLATPRQHRKLAISKNAILFNRIHLQFSGCMALMGLARLFLLHIEYDGETTIPLEPRRLFTEGSDITLRGTEEGRVKSRCLGLDKSTKLIRQLSRAFGQTVIIVDAIDECNKETRYQLLSALKKLRSSTEGIKIFITSRNDDDIRVELEDESEVYIQPSDNSSDSNCL
ncbi:hypothetical protein RUND412_001094 [Rhizina undulata]